MNSKNQFNELMKERHYEENFKKRKFQKILK